MRKSADFKEIFSKEVIVYNCCPLVCQFASFSIIVVILSTFNSLFVPLNLWIQPIENSFLIHG